jgi:UDP-N-acetylglucosamine 2-epimerase (non-hydrolysing)
MSTPTFMHVVGARPNFMKAAPVYRALGRRHAPQILVHTGQHYDPVMSGAIFNELGLPEPDVNLGVGSGSHAEQTAHVLVAIEQQLLRSRPDVLIVYGDVNSTLAAALAAAKLGIPVAHVEAGLRSGDWSMPEEINRVVTDRLAQWLFTPSRDGNDNLIREGARSTSIRLVGNVMIDTLVRLLPCADGGRELALFNLHHGRSTRPFVLVTLHRPSNVDDPAMLSGLMVSLDRIAADAPVIFPVHPRTRERLRKFAIPTNRVTLSEPLTYLQFLGLQRHAALVITDSGGVQEETTFLGVPCLTMRENTERPITVSVGTNVLVGRHVLRMEQEARAVLNGRPRRGEIPELWDGHAADRIADVLT